MLNALLKEHLHNLWLAGGIILTKDVGLERRILLDKRIEGIIGQKSGQDLCLLGVFCVNIEFDVFHIM